MAYDEGMKEGKTNKWPLLGVGQVQSLKVRLHGKEALVCGTVSTETQVHGGPRAHSSQ